MEPLELFEHEKKERLARQAYDEPLKNSAQMFMAESLRARYSYNFSWLGRPIIQYPEDVMALQEIIWRVRPRLIIETGVAHGGSVILSASLLEMLGGEGRVLGLDIDIRAHNRPLIENHPLARRLTLMECSSLAPEAAAKAAAMVAETRGGPVMVILDSLHTHEHVLGEMRLYGSFVTPGSYLVVFDGVLENYPEANAPDRPWGPGNSPLSALREFLAENDSFVVDEEIETKLLITAAPSGYLRRVK